MTAPKIDCLHRLAQLLDHRWVEALSRQRHRPPPEEWLRKRLEKRPRTAGELRKLAKKYGYSDRELERARDRIGVRCTREGGQRRSRWHLPNQEGTR